MEDTRPAHELERISEAHLRIFKHPEATSDKFCRKIDGGAFEESKRDRVNEYVGWIYCRMREVTWKKCQTGVFIT